jgi:hypothetical protein
MGQSFWWDRKNRGPMSQQVWHDKDPSLLKGPERRVHTALHRQWWHLHISINSWAGRKTVNNQRLNTVTLTLDFDQDLKIYSWPLSLNQEGYGFNMRYKKIFLLPRLDLVTLYFGLHFKNCMNPGYKLDGVMIFCIALPPRVLHFILFPTQRVSRLWQLRVALSSKLPYVF